MSNDDLYHTLKARAEGDYREKGSKFLAYAFPCETEEMLKEHILALKKSHPSARHLCYAAIIGAERPEERSSDAGEPAGTAGLPILNQLLSAKLKNAAIVVVRYFGGTKLGKAGLIHAYKESARVALENASIEERLVTRAVIVHFDYPQSGAVMRFIGQIPHVVITEQEFVETCKITLAIPKSEVSNTLSLFDRLPNVHATLPD